MKLKKVLASILCVAMVLGTMGTVAFANGDTTVELPEVDVAVGEGYDYAEWSSDMLANAKDLDGDDEITFGIYGKVMMPTRQIKGSAETINIIGMTDDAELVVEEYGKKPNPPYYPINANIYIKDSAIRTVNFSDLTLTRLGGAWTDDADNTNKFFTVWTYTSSAQQVNYTNCVFPNGSGNAYPGKTVYTDCDFNNTGDSDFGVWVYAKGETEIKDCRFNSNGGVKTYGYASQTEMNTVIENTEFNVTEKPAVVVSGLGTIALENVDVEDCTYGVWETAVVGGNMATVTLDGEKPTYAATCTDKYGVTVYVTDVDYADVVAEEANSTTNSTIDNIAKIVGEDGYVTYYTSLHAAISEAQSGDVVEVLKDETYAGWNSIWNKDGITINGNGNTISVNEPGVNSGINGGGMLLNASNLTINDLTVVLPEHSAEMPRLATMKSGTLNNVTVKGGTFAVSLVGEGPVEINNCTFEDLGDWAIETEGKAASASLTISNSTFDEAAVILRGENNIFTGNTIIGAGEGVNVLGDAVISGNDFGESSLGIDRGVEVVVEKNIINNVEFSEWLTGDYSEVTVENNKLSDEAVAEMNDKLDAEVVSVDPVAEVDGKKFFSLADAVAALEDGDTLKIATGTYDAFEVLADNVTITGMTDDAEITVGSTTDTAFIGVGGHNVTIKGIKFVVPETVAGNQNWMTSVIGFASSQQNYGGVEPNGWDVIDCDFVQAGDALGIAIFNCDNFTVDDCTFENFGTAICTMGDGRALDTVSITDNTFTKVDVPVNLYWGQPGDENGSLTITGNKFVSAKAADEIKIAIDDYASRNAGISGIDALDLSGNTFNATTEVEIVDASVSITEDVKEDLANADNVVIDERYAAVARIGNDKYYTSLEAAVEAADADDEVIITKDIEIAETVVIDKNLTLVGIAPAVQTFATTTTPVVTIKGADSDGTTRGVTPIAVEDDVTLTLENVKIVGGDGYNANSNDEIVAGSAVAVDGGTLNVNNSILAGGWAYGGGFTAGNAIVVKNSGKVIVTNSDLYAGDYYETDFTGQMDSPVINADGTSSVSLENVSLNSGNNWDRGFDYTDYTSQIMYADPSAQSELIDTPVTMSGKIEVTGSNPLRNLTVNVPEGKTVEFVGNVDTETVIIITDNINVEFEEAKDENGNKKDGVYDIYLNAGNGKLIWEFVSAELVFENGSKTLTGQDMDYEIVPASNIFVNENIANEGTFNFNIKPNADGISVERITDTKILLGQIVFPANGAYKLSVNDGASKVVATKYTTSSDEQDYVAGSKTHNLTADAIDSTVQAATRDIIVKVDFVHDITDSAKDFKVTLRNANGYTEEKTLGIANNTGDTKFEYVEIGNVTVTLEAEGFRKYTYRTTLEEGEGEVVLNFWNDWKGKTPEDPEREIEAGKKKYSTNFIVGDIAMDYIVDKYDLAAVTSYYGTYGYTNANFVKYDLNRDGNIDIDDVAYVLHNFGK